MFDKPLHSVVPAICRDIEGADRPNLVALRFMGEMEAAGWVKFQERKQDRFAKDLATERIVVPTKKLLKLKLHLEDIGDHITAPYVVGEDMPPSSFPVRNGIGTFKNKGKVKVALDIADEKFTINEFTLGLVEKYAASESKVSNKIMFERMLHHAEVLTSKVFTFAAYLDSRSRHYTFSTCGVTTQGDDVEKSIVIPIYQEVLTDDGYSALLEAAEGYSEMGWPAAEMAKHARYPDDTKDEWLQADKPFCYMACAELILRYQTAPELPLPSFTPLDGRCSGLQHWSAVTRSRAITAHLGMELIEHKLDIYEKVAEDWGRSLELAYKYLANRKAAKIPTMTWGYNATVSTSINHMKDLYGVKSEWSTEDECYVAVGDGLDAKACAKHGVDIFNQLKGTLGALQSVVDWVSDSAYAIGKLGNIEIRWVTEDGFICRQRKVKAPEITIQVVLSNKERMTLGIRDFDNKEADARKHKAAIAPNVIHSLDATHLRMVARRLKELGLPMVFIHDSFSTHSNHRNTLYRIIVEEFIELYSGNYMLKLKEYWEAEYGVELPNPPEQEDWDVQILNDCPRFFA